MKKLLSVILALSMMMSLFCAVPVSANTLPDNIATDYVAGAVTGNLMKSTVDFTSAEDTILKGTWFPSATSSSVYPSNVPSWQGKYLWVWANADVTEANANVANGQGVGGASINKALFDVEQIQAGDGVVIMADISQNRGAPHVKTALYQYNKMPIYPVEYPNPKDCLLIDADASTDAPSSAKLVTTLPVPEEGWGGIENTNFYIGFAPTDIENEGERRFIVTLSSFYMGVEYAYDMTLTADDRELFAGKSIDVDVEVVNQGNSVGTLAQTVTWYATNTNRTETVNGFAFTENEDGTYSVSVDRTVAAGTYDIVAVSDANKNIVKGIEVTVLEAPSFDDYEAPVYENEFDIPGNIISGENTLNTTYNYNYHRHNVKVDGESAASSDMRTSGTHTDGAIYIGSSRTRDIINPLYTLSDTDGDGDVEWDEKSYTYHNGVSGLNITTSAPAGATGRVVFSFNMRETASPSVVNIARRNKTYGSDKNSLRIEYPIGLEGGNKGFAPTSGYATYTGTFADTGATSDKYEYAIGYVEGTKASSQMWFKPWKSYIGYEYAYDMTVKSSDTMLYPGKEITLSADIINQIGNEFGGNANVSWTAMDSNRENTVNGFTFTENKDGTYTVTVDETVAAGAYDLVAISSANDKLIKGVEISVTKNPYADYVPGEITGNMVTNDTLSLTYNYHHRAKLEGETARKDDVNLVDSGDYYYIKAMRDMDNPSVAYEDKDGDGIVDTPSSAPYYHQPFAGGAVSTTVIDSTKTGRVVFSLQVKNGNSSITAPTVGIGRRNSSIGSTSNPARIEYPLESEYNAENKGFVAGTSYQTFKGTFANTGATPDKYAYVIGLAGGSKTGEIVHILKSSAYIGYEYAYAMTVTSEAETAEQGAMFNVEASVVNQIGNTYGGTEAITWKAMSQDRLSEIDGITVTATDKGTAAVEIGADVVPGTYDIVAVLGDGVMAKGVPVTVTESAVETIEGITIVKTAGGIVVATDTSLTDAQLIFVIYDANGKLIAVNNETKVTLSAQGAQEYAIPTGFEAAKVMFFTADFKPLANVLN